MKLMSAEGLDIGYTSALQTNLAFTLNRGEVLVIRGPNGSGKSSLIRTILGQIPALRGKIEVSSETRIEYLPQNVADDFLLSLNLSEILESYSVDVSDLEIKIADDLKTRWIDSSGGEKRKTLICTRLVTACDILILDEPFNHLDTSSVDNLVSFLKKLIETGRVGGVILVSHLFPDFSEIQVKRLEFDDRVV